MKNVFYFLVLLLTMLACSTDEDLVTERNVVSDDIITPTTWTADKTWVIEGTINVTSDLVIQPGTVVTFNENAELIIGYGAYGSLKAEGTEDKPIVFTSSSASPSAGDYRGISFFDNASSSSALSYCTFEYGGSTNGYGAGLYIEYTSVSVSNCTLKHSASVGVLNYNGSFGTFSKNTVTNCADYPVELPAAAAHKLDSLSVLSGRGVFINDPSVGNQKVTWQALSVPYIANAIDINENAELTLFPGVEIQFLSEGSIEVGYATYGKLTANGTAASPIVFTSAAVNPSKGDWRGISVFEKAGSNTSFDNCTIAYAGSNSGYGANLYVEYAAITLQNSTIAHGEQLGVENYNGTFLVFSNNEISDFNSYPVSAPAKTIHILTTDNAISGSAVFINDGELTNRQVTWNKLTVPYMIQDLYIYDDAELTLNPGISLLFKADGYIEIGYSSFGKLVALGTEASPILFSSAASSPSPGDWIGLEFFEKTVNGSKLTYCSVAYAGNDSGYGANIYSEYNNTKLTIENSTISGSASCGIKTYESTPTLTNIVYQNNGDDLCID